MTVSSDLAWAKRTGGRLSHLHKAALVWNVLRWRFLSRRTAMSNVDAMGADTQLPDSSIVKAALSECRDTCSEAITQHCLRTYSWGCVFAAGRDMKFDREVLAVASLLHDIEMGRTRERASTGCCCFACAGAVRAEAFAIAHGRERDWARRIGDAIALHLDAIVPPSRGVEAHLLQAGAGLDVIGAGLSQIPPTVRAAVLAQYPRDGFKTEMAQTMEREAAYGEGTRAEFLMSRGFARHILRAPLD